MIGAFNVRGSWHWAPKWSGGRPAKFGPAARQATKTWKASIDPDCAAKTAGILDLYDRPPADWRVLCIDEFGPLNPQPRPGRGWFPARLPATCTRTGGVRHISAALDPARGQLFYRFRDHKRWRAFLVSLKPVRARFPGGKLYNVCDSYSPHTKAEGAPAGARPTMSNWRSRPATPRGCTGPRPS